MKNKKITLNDIIQRKADVAYEIEKTRCDIKQEVYNFTHPFASIKKNGFRTLPSVTAIIGIINKIHLVYKISTKVYSLFKKR